MSKVTREHRSIAIDLTPNQNETMENQIDNLLRKAQTNNEISGYYFNHMFNEDVSHEHKD